MILDKDSFLGFVKYIENNFNFDFLSKIPGYEEDYKIQKESILKLIKNKKSIILLNKNDLKNVIDENNEKIKNASKNILKISALNKTGLEELYNKITEMFNLNEINLDNELLITNVRHKNIIEKAIQNVKMANEALLNGMPIDIITIYIKQILDDLGEITGDCVTEDIINEIFSKFCLGK